MELSLEGIAKHLKAMLPDNIPQSYFIKPIYHSIGDESSLRNGVLAFKDFLHQFFDCIIASANLYDNPKRNVTETRFDIKFDLDYPFLYDTAILLFQIGVCGEINKNGDSLALDVTTFQASLKKARAKIAIEHLSFLADCGLEFHGIDLNEKRLDLSVIDILDVSYPDNPIMLLGLKSMAKAQLEVINNKYQNVFRYYAWNDQIFLRCDYKALTEEGLTPQSILTCIVKPFPLTTQKFVLQLHQQFLDLGCTCIWDANDAKYRFDYDYKSKKRKMVIQITPHLGCELIIHTLNINKYIDSVEKFPPFLLEILTNGSACVSNPAPSKCKLTPFTINGKHYAKCLSVSCGANTFWVPLVDFTDDKIEAVVKWVKLELSL